jgi:hypothetical protein
MKRILVIAKQNPAEALRVAAGLTLLNESVRVAILGDLPDDPAVQEQRELLDFIEVPVDTLADTDTWPAQLAATLLQSELVYTL